MARVRRRRRSCLAVPASNPRMLAKAATLPCDQLFMDLEDAVAPARKEQAREHAIEALTGIDYGERVRTVRVNDVTSRWAVRDVVELVTRAGDRLDCVMVPKVAGADHVHFVDHLLGGLEQEIGRSEPIGLELLIESPQGATSIAEIARASDRIETLIFGVGDYQVSMGIPRFDLGVVDPEYPGVQWQWVMSEIANHARARGIQAIDGPYVALDDADGYVRSARRGKALGFHGKWCVHPSQIELAHAAYATTDEERRVARTVLAAYERAAEAGAGAAVFEGLMIDEASRKLAVDVLDDGA